MSYQFYVTLFTNLQVDTPTGAGWYITGTIGDKKIETIGIPENAAMDVAVALQKALQASDEELPQISIPHLASNASGAIRHALEQQLREAEAQAARVAMLRRKLATLAPPRQES